MSYLASVAATMMLYVFSAIILWNRAGAGKGRIWILAALALIQGVWIMPLARLASAYGRKDMRDGMETAYMFMAAWGFMVCGIWFFYWLTSRVLAHLGG